MRALICLALSALGACAAPSARPMVPDKVALPYLPLGLERVLNQDAASLVRLFGPPDAEVREGPAYKLQFASGICVLDAYLYPGAGEPRVSYLDARTPQGGPIDRASCVAALTRRPAAR